MMFKTLCPNLITFTDMLSVVDQKKQIMKKIQVQKKKNDKICKIKKIVDNF